MRTRMQHWNANPSNDNNLETTAAIDPALPDLITQAKFIVFTPCRNHWRHRSHLPPPLLLEAAGWAFRNRGRVYTHVLSNSQLSRGRGPGVDQPLRSRLNLALVQASNLNGLASV